MRRIRAVGSALIVVFALAWVTPAHAAGLTLTSAATTAGFGLTTFADGFPNTGFCCGPLGIAFPSSGGVLIADAPGNAYLFGTNTDGQHASTVTPVTGYGNFNATGLASLGGTVYMAEQTAGRIVQLNNNGTFNRNVALVNTATGIVGDDANGLLYVSTGSAIYTVNPATGTAVFFKGGGFDGLTLDSANQILYAEDSGHIVGYNLGTGNLIFDSGAIAGAPDGAAFGTGTLAGNIFVNTNGGTLVEVNIATLAQTVIATGGSRGDFVSVDPNGTLLLTQTDSVLRLTAPSGACFGSSCVSDNPEPATGTLLMGGMGSVLLLAAWKKRRR